MARVLIGTSGWTYGHWRGVFYPPRLASRHYLEFYSQEFTTAELNYSFYHVPKKESYVRWASVVPEGFVLAVKAHRSLTHLKRLHGIESDWVGFVEHARSLGSHLGPILVQLPPSFRCDVGRLKDFLAASAPLQVRLVLEFRHESWFTSQVYRLLSQHQVAHCIADSSRRRRRDVVTTDFIYLRFHGRDRSGQSVGYSDTELREEAEQLARHLEEGLDIFAYFNNDAHAHAIKNARTLKTLCRKIGIDVGGGVSVRENP